MKKVLGLILLGLFILSGSITQAKEWYEVKGNQHRATVEEYLDADYADALSTTGDWVTASTSKEAQDKIKTMDVYKKGAQAVYQCIKTAAKDGGPILEQKAVEMAVMCMALLKENYPWMLTRKNK